MVRGAWRSLEAHLNGVQGVGGSNPLAPTSDFSYLAGARQRRVNNPLRRLVRLRRIQISLRLTSPLAPTKRHRAYANNINGLNAQKRLPGKR